MAVAGNDIARFRSNNGNCDIVIGAAVDRVASIYTLAGQGLAFGTNGGAERMRIDASGDVSFNGNISVAGTKCRVVKTPYGELKMNAVESAHALFIDDEPSTRLVSGRCRVNLSPKYLATVTVGGKYPLAVNITFYGRHGGEWYVERDDTGFTVIDPSGSGAEFSWQAIARQKGYEATDLEPVIQTAAKQGGRP